MKAKPKYYPQVTGGIELSGQAIIRLQQHFGIGAPEALKFSYAVQRCIWVTEEGDHCDLEVLKKLARDCGISDDALNKCLIDRRGDDTDAAVKAWNKFHDEAVELGTFLMIWV